jgi:threonine/homoserine/homoserine lactone efflux protein
MLSFTTLLGFSAASLLLLLIPGPGFMYLLARSVSQGRRAGLVSALGLSTGTLVHILSATLGLSAILLTSATAFSFVKAIGAAYLVFLGIQTIRSGQPLGKPDDVQLAPISRLFIDGVFVSVFNPKIALFFIAFLPQFIDPNLGKLPLQFLTLGLLFVVLATLVDGAFAYIAGTLHHKLLRKIERSPLPRYASGAVYIGLGIGTAFAEQPTS